MLKLASRAHLLNLILLAAPLLAQIGLGNPAGQFGTRAFPNDPASLPLVTRELVQETQRFVEDANYELAGTQPGQQVITQGLALAQEAQRLDATLSRFGPNSRQFQGQAAAFERPLWSVQSAIGPVSSVAPGAVRRLRRIEWLAEDLRSLSVPPGGGVIGPSLPGSNIDRGAFRNASIQAANSLNYATNILIDGGWSQQPPYDRIIRDLNGLASNIAELIAFVDRQVADNVLRQRAGTAQNRANRLNNQIATAPGVVPRSFTTVWNQTLRSLDEAVLLSGGGGGVPPIQPPVFPPVRPPVVPPIVPPVQPPVYPPGPNLSQAFPLVDAMMAQVDAFVSTVSVTVNAVPEGFQFLREGRELQASLASLRQAMASDAGRGTIQNGLREVENRYRRLLRRVERVSKGRPGPNNDRIRSLVPVLDQLRAVLSY